MNAPWALRTHAGINAYVAYQVVGQFGSGKLTYQQAMTAIFVEGWIFILLSITGVRGGIVKFMPKSIALASSGEQPRPGSVAAVVAASARLISPPAPPITHPSAVGIGLLLSFTGLRSLGVVVFDQSTLVGLGGCSEGMRTYIYTFNQPINSTNVTSCMAGAQQAYTSVYGCQGGEVSGCGAVVRVLAPSPTIIMFMHAPCRSQMRSATMWLGIAGGYLMAVLMYMGVKGSLIIGIAFITVVSWIPGHAASYLGSGSPIPGAPPRPHPPCSRLHDPGYRTRNTGCYGT